MAEVVDEDSILLLYAPDHDLQLIDLLSRSNTQKRDGREIDAPTGSSSQLPLSIYFHFVPILLVYINGKGLCPELPF